MFLFYWRFLKGFCFLILGYKFIFVVMGWGILDSYVIELYSWSEGRIVVFGGLGRYSYREEKVVRLKIDIKGC